MRQRKSGKGKKRWKKDTKIGHIKAVMKGEGEGELLLVGRSDRHSVIFMFDQGRRI